MIDKKPFFDHPALRKRIEASRAMTQLTYLDIRTNADQWALTGQSFDEPITYATPHDALTNPSDDKLGYMVDARGRAVLRVASEDDAEKLGTICATAPELMNFMHRIEDLPFIESAAILAQFRAVKLTELLAAILPALQSQELPDRKQIIALSTLLHQIKAEDAETEAARRQRDLKQRYQVISPEAA